MKSYIEKEKTTLVNVKWFVFLKTASYQRSAIYPLQCECVLFCFYDITKLNYSLNLNALLMSLNLHNFTILLVLGQTFILWPGTLSCLVCKR